MGFSLFTFVFTDTAIFATGLSDLRNKRNMYVIVIVQKRLVGVILNEISNIINLLLSKRASYKQ